MGYILNSNATGFRYNDSTAMISNASQTRYKYIEYDPKTKKLSEPHQTVQQQLRWNKLNIKVQNFNSFPQLANKNKG